MQFLMRYTNGRQWERQKYNYDHYNITYYSLLIFLLIILFDKMGYSLTVAH